jgi:hypothetical protein
MKKLATLLIFLSISCASVEQRITETSYTNEWYYEGTTRYQVYQTKNHRKYIIVLNRAETKFIRKYLKG